MSTNDIQTVELIRGQRLASLNRIEAAYSWIEKQDLHDVQRFQISLNDDFKDHIRISIHLHFESHEKAQYWAAKNLKDVRKSSSLYSGILAYYASDFPDFTVYANFNIEQNHGVAV